MKSYRCFALTGWLILVGSSAEAQTAPAAPAKPTPANEAVVLNPFTVTADADVGYQGGNTTSGSRLNARLKDTAAAVHVFTQEFLSDFGFNTFEEMTAYAPNIQLDFQDTNEAANPAILGQSNNLNQAYRVRGLRASHGVDYFTTTIPIDGYNSGRLELAAGPNSVLFGLGSAGGVTNLSVKRAELRKTFGSTRLQFGSWKHQRAELDHNQVLLPGRLSLRVMGLWQDAEDWRHYDFHKIKRATLSAGARLWRDASLTASYEEGYHHDHITRPSNALDSLSLWTARGAPIFDANAYVNADRSRGIARSANIRNVWVSGTNTGAFFIPVANANNQRILESQAEDLGLPTTQRAGATLLPPSQHPYDFSYFGPSASKRTDFDRRSAIFDQKLGRDGALQLAVMREHTLPNSINVQGPGGSLFGDPNSVIPNPNGTTTLIPNPNAGRYYMEANWGLDNGRYDTLRGRATASWKLDFGKWFGSHNLAGLFETGNSTSESYPSYEILVDANNVPISVAAQPENANNRLIRRTYVTPGQFESYYMGNVFEPVNLTLNGRQYHTAFVNQNLNRTKLRQEVDSLMFATQSKFWQDRLIVTAGLRFDEVKNREFGATRYAPTDPRAQSGQVIANGLVFDDAVVSITSAKPRTQSLGGVFHVTPQVSLFYNQSSSVGEISAIRRILPDLALPPQPAGVTHDYGFMLTLLDGRVYLRATAYKTNEENRVSATLAAATFGIPNNNILDTLLAAGRINAAVHEKNYFGNTGLITSLADVKNDGYELTLSLNPSRNLTAQINFSATNIDRSNIVPEYDVWRARAEPLWFANPANAALTTASGLTVRQESEVIQQYIADLRQQLGFNWGDRKYKGNISGRYTFTTGRLNGVFAGGGVRWAAKANIGRTPAGTAIKGPEDFVADAFVGYRTRLTFAGAERKFTVQLNCYNVTDEDVFQPLRYNLLYTGYARGLLERPRNFRFSFGMEY
jgi:iron complex outermembrane receptor protein